MPDLLKNDSARDAAPLSGRTTALLLLAVAVGYMIVSALTTWTFIGDAPDYARSAIAQFKDGDCAFLEFGHVMWRPTGYGLLRIATSGRGLATDDSGWLEALSLLNGTAWIAGLVTLLALTLWLRDNTRSAGAVAAGVAFVLFNKSFLNFSHVGTSYVPALAGFALTLWLGAREGKSPIRHWGRAMLAGVCLAGSMLFWATYVFAAPAVLLAPLVAHSDWRRRLPTVAVTGLTCAIAMLSIYAWVGGHLELHSLAAYRQWVSASQHGITFGGPARAVVGLARFVVDLGDYGSEAKRFLVKDPYYPVSLRQLFNVELVKLLGVYCFAAVSVVLAWRAPAGWRAVVLFVLGFGPVIAFGVFWQGGDLERYLPALPFIALIVATAFGGASRGGETRRSFAAASFVAVLMAVAWINMRAMSAGRIQRQSDEALARLDGIPNAALHRDLFVVSHWHDPLMSTVRDRPFHPVVRRGFAFYPLVTFGTPQVESWRGDFARKMLTSWRSGRHVWVSTRLLADRPERSWAWIEGDDPRVKWRDLPDQFRSLEFVSAANDSAFEFRQLAETPRNREVLSALVGVGDAEEGDDAPSTSSCRKIKISDRTP